MGYNLSWVAVKGGDSDTVHRTLNVSPAGGREEFQESPIVGAALPSGWYLVIVDGSDDCDVHDQEILAILSSGGEAISCAVLEGTMFSMASHWRAGVQTWSVMHNASQGVYSLDIEGELPPEFSAIHDNAKSAQDADGGKTADVDHLFDVPIELAKSITGFRYDEDIGGAGEFPFVVLETQTTTAQLKKRSILERLFRR